MMDRLQQILQDMPITLWTLAGMLVYLQVVLIGDLTGNGGLAHFVATTDLERVALTFSPRAGLVWITRLEAKARFIRRTDHEDSNGAGV